MLDQCSHLKQTQPPYRRNFLTYPTFDMGGIKALFIGCSYDDQGDLEMQAGKHDVKQMAQFIKNNYDIRDSRTYHEDASESRLPTRENILDAINWLVSGLGGYDEAFFYFAGHGGLKNGVSHILPMDHDDEGNITARTLRDGLVHPLPNGFHMTAFFQHCHSGNSLELPMLYPTPRDLYNQTSRNTEYVVPFANVVCIGASNLELNAHHSDGLMSNVTKALIDNCDSNSTLYDVFQAIVPADRHARPEFSCSWTAYSNEMFLGRGGGD